MRRTYQCCEQFKCFEEGKPSHPLHFQDLPILSIFKNFSIVVKTLGHNNYIERVLAEIHVNYPAGKVAVEVGVSVGSCHQVLNKTFL